MATFVVGDVQGCFDSLMELVEAIRFDAREDELWFVGDIVNRGPKNVEVLRWIRDLGDRATVVLGNHDLHLLAFVAGARELKRRDTIADVGEAGDRDELIDWLRSRPILHERATDVLVHAGVLPSWSLDDAKRQARTLAEALSGHGWRDAIGQIVADRTAGLGAISNVFQRVRVIDSLERVVDYDGHPRGAPTGAVPWFEVEHNRGPDTRVIFGHWSTLGLHIRPDAVCIDTGCVWGRSLTAFRLEDGTVTSVPSAGRGAPR